MQLGFVCTNFNNAGYTRAAIASLHAGGRGQDVHTVVVDNHSDPEDVAVLQEVAREFPGVDLVLNAENIGYFPGLNVGIRHVRTRHPSVTHLVVGNNDLVFPVDFIPVVERNQALFESWAVVAPDLVTPEGVHQNPHVLHPIGRVRKRLWDLYYLSYGLGVGIRWAARLAGRLTARPENSATSELYQRPGPVEQGYGACYLLGPAFFRHFTQFAAPTFLMQEEFFLYEQLKGIGQLTYYDPRFVVHHTGHASMGRIPSRRHWEIARAAHLVYKRYLAMRPTEQSAFLARSSGALA